MAVILYNFRYTIHSGEVAWLENPSFSYMYVLLKRKWFACCHVGLLEGEMGEQLTED